jgi:hypothetical protein
MHYTGMAALRAHAAPGLAVSTSATASAAAFLLPLILGLSSIGFIFSAVIALSPTAAEIFEEDEVMKRVAQSQAGRYEPQARPDRAQPYQTQAHQTQAHQTQAHQTQLGSLFRPQQSAPENQP